MTAVYKHHARTGILMLAGSGLAAAAAFLALYGALVAAERPLTHWYRNRNH